MTLRLFGTRGSAVLLLALATVIPGEICGQKADKAARSSALIEEVGKLVNEGRANDALRILDNALRNDANNEVLLHARGTLHLKARRTKHGFADCDAAVRAKADFARAYHCRAIAYAYMGDQKAALKDLSMALKLDPEFVAAYESRAGINQGKGNLQEALEDYNVIVKLNKDDSTVFWRRANLRLSLNQPEAALADLDEAVRLQPTNTTALQDRARIHERLKNFDKAIADYTEILKSNPNSAEAHLNRGYAYVQSGKQDLAKADFDKAIAASPSYADVVKRILAEKAQGTTAATSASAAPGPQSDLESVKPTVSAPQTRKTVIAGTGPVAPARATPAPTTTASAPPPPQTPTPEPAAPAPAPAPAEKDGTSELREILASASQFERAKDSAKAIEAYSKALALKPDLPNTLLDRGRLYMETKQFAKASADFQAAIKHSPKNPKAHFGACAAALSLNQFQEAVNACSEVLKLERSGDAAHYRAQAHLALKNVDAAIADLRLSTQIKLDAPDAFFQLGQIYQQNGDLVNALNSYTRAIQQKGTYADAYKARAQIRSYLGDTAGSSDDTTRAAASLKR